MRLLILFQVQVAGLVPLQLLVAQAPIGVVSSLLHAQLHLMAQANAELALEEYGVMHPGNGLSAVLRSNSAYDVHDFGFIMLVQVGQDLGLAGSAAGGLQERLAQQVPVLDFDQVKQVCIQQGLLVDEGLHRGVSQEPSPVCAVFDDVDQGGVCPPAGVVLPARGGLAGAKADGGKGSLEQLGLQIPGYGAGFIKGEVLHRGHEVGFVFQEIQRGVEDFTQILALPSGIDVLLGPTHLPGHHA